LRSHYRYSNRRGEVKFKFKFSSVKEGRRRRKEDIEKGETERGGKGKEKGKEEKERGGKRGGKE
jgi:hypothetical protein